MKKYLSIASFCIGALLLNNFVVVAQDKDDKGNAQNKIGEYDEIIIKRKDAGKNGKVTIEIKDDEVRVNGKPLDEFEDKNLSVRKKKAVTYGLTAPSPFRSSDITESDRPFLGVITDDTEGGAKITAITKNSAAEKAGLLKGDIITMINSEKVENQGDVSAAIRKLKPEDKVTITYKREGKENKVTATLGKRSGANTVYSPNHNFEFNHDFDINERLGQVFSYGGRPRIGLKAQDTEDGKGVKVIDVDEGSAAEKSGIKKDDVITEFEGKAVNSADALAEASREASDKSSLKIKLNRGGSSQTIEVKIPRKLKTTNL